MAPEVKMKCSVKCP